MSSAVSSPPGAVRWARPGRPGSLRRAARALRTRALAEPVSASRASAAGRASGPRRPERRGLGLRGAAGAGGAVHGADGRELRVEPSPCASETVRKRLLGSQRAAGRGAFRCGAPPRPRRGAPVGPRRAEAGEPAGLAPAPQRVERVLGGPEQAGAVYHSRPERRTGTMPARTRRSSTRGPPRGFLGRSGRSRTHCAAGRRQWGADMEHPRYGGALNHFTRKINRL